MTDGETLYLTLVGVSVLAFMIALAYVRIPMKTATDSDGKRPPVPIQSGHFSRGSNLAS